MELQQFKEDMIKKEPEEIYGNAYQIDCMINFTELLYENSEMMKEETLKILLPVPNLLKLIYEKWMDQIDAQLDELWFSAKNTIKELGGYKK